jgi:DNA-directed RNA polymerase specialized sigma24 family protein
MKNYQNSDYALNKHSGGIVYRFADGSRFTITQAAYLAENPDKTEADFLALKALSDEDYHERDKTDYRQTWKDAPLDALAETEFCSVPSPEAAVIDAPEEAERRRSRAAIAKEALDKLTDVQRRRYLLHTVGGLTTREIAAKEGVAQQVADRSIVAAKKKIKKILSGS